MIAWPLARRRVLQLVMEYGSHLLEVQQPRSIGHRRLLQAMVPLSKVDSRLLSDLARNARKQNGELSASRTDLLLQPFARQHWRQDLCSSKRGTARKCRACGAPWRKPWHSVASRRRGSQHWRDSCVTSVTLERSRSRLHRHRQRLNFQRLKVRIGNSRLPRQPNRVRFSSNCSFILLLRHLDPMARRPGACPICLPS